MIPNDKNKGRFWKRRDGTMRVEKLTDLTDNDKQEIDEYEGQFKSDTSPVSFGLIQPHVQPNVP